MDRIKIKLKNQNVPKRLFFCFKNISFSVIFINFSQFLKKKILSFLTLPVKMEASFHEKQV